MGQSVERGQILAEGEAIRDGGLALGRNVVVAYMPWRGYNFEDAIVVSESMARAFATTHATEVRVPVFRDEAGEFIKRSGPDARGARCWMKAVSSRSARR